MSAGPEQAAELQAAVAAAEARLPLLGLAPVFLPEPARPLFLAWAALVDEWQEAAFESSDPRVRTARCAWWAEELAGMARGASRHPLARRLAAPALPWVGLAQALLPFAEDDAPAADAAAAETALWPLASALALLDARLSGSAAVSPEDVRRFVRHAQVRVLASGCGLEGAAGIPLAFWARHGRRRDEAGTAPEVHRDWARHLQQSNAPPRRGESLLCRLLADSDRRQLAALAAGRRPLPPPLWRRPFAAWRCARDAALQYRLPPVADT